MKSGKTVRNRQTKTKTRRIKGGYTSYFPTKQSEIQFAENYFQSMRRRLSKEEKIAKTYQFMQSVMHFRHLLEDKLFIRAAIQKLEEFEEFEINIPTNFHADRAQAILFLEQYD